MKLNIIKKITLLFVIIGFKITAHANLDHLNSDIQREIKSFLKCIVGISNDHKNYSLAEKALLNSSDLIQEFRSISSRPTTTYKTLVKSCESARANLQNEMKTSASIYQLNQSTEKMNEYYEQLITENPAIKDAKVKNILMNLFNSTSICRMHSNTVSGVWMLGGGAGIPVLVCTSSNGTTRRYAGITIVGAVGAGGDISHRIDLFKVRDTGLSLIEGTLGTRTAITILIAPVLTESRTCSSESTECDKEIKSFKKAQAIGLGIQASFEISGLTRIWFNTTNYNRLHDLLIK